MQARAPRVGGCRDYTKRHLLPQGSRRDEGKSRDCGGVFASLQRVKELPFCSRVPSSSSEFQDSSNRFPYRKGRSSPLRQKDTQMQPQPQVSPPEAGPHAISTATASNWGNIHCIADSGAGGQREAAAARKRADANFALQPGQWRHTQFHATSLDVSPAGTDPVRP